MKTCNACGMPLNEEQPQFFSKGDVNSDFCKFCTNEDGSVKSCEEVFEGGVQFFLTELGGDRARAERVTRKNMQQQPYWLSHGSDILQGDTATDEEFAEVMKVVGD